MVANKLHQIFCEKQHPLQLGMRPKQASDGWAAEDTGPTDSCVTYTCDGPPSARGLLCLQDAHILNHLSSELHSQSARVRVTTQVHHKIFHMKILIEGEKKEKKSQKNWQMTPNTFSNLYGKEAGTSL